MQQCCIFIFADASINCAAIYRMDKGISFEARIIIIGCAEGHWPFAAGQGRVAPGFAANQGRVAPGRPFRWFKLEGRQCEKFFLL